MAEPKKSIGGIWVNTPQNKSNAKTSGKYLSISFKLDGKTFNLVAYKNQFKDKSKNPQHAPDFVVYESTAKKKKSENTFLDDSDEENLL